MSGQTVEIRLQLLKDIGAGLSKAETVKHLKDRFGITESGAYYHFKTRPQWLEQYRGFDKELTFTIIERFNYIYREASFQYLHAQNDNARVGYLRVMTDANCKIAEYGVLPQLQSRLEVLEGVKKQIE